MKQDERIKLFEMSVQMAERDLDAVEEALKIELGRQTKKGETDEAYYPQFGEAVRHEAAVMAQHYEIFYCLERSIRELVHVKLEAELSPTWWDTAVPETIRNNVQKNIDRERDSGVTMRSADKLDYTTFGELGEIVRSNWPVFSDTFNSEKAFTKIMTSLNVLRGPIAHCSPLAEDEIVRLRLTLRDWFRLME
ncbi:MAG: Swt1 family HEPN domain-containing protein [Anaerolineales bacterium]